MLELQGISDGSKVPFSDVFMTNLAEEFEHFLPNKTSKLLVGI